MNIRQLSQLYSAAHDAMRNIDGLQPQEAFDELLKYLFFKETNEEVGPEVSPSFVLAANSPRVNLRITRRVRMLFRSYVRESNGTAAAMWTDPRFRLSDATLDRVHALIYPVNLSSLGFDVRGSALKTFLPPEVRKGLGIFLTPDDVARMMVEVVDPQPDWRVFDPACVSVTA